MLSYIHENLCRIFQLNYLYWKFLGFQLIRNKNVLLKISRIAMEQNLKGYLLDNSAEEYSWEHFHAKNYRSYF